MRQSSNKPARIIYYRLLAIALCTFILWQSYYTGIISQPLLPYDDKVLHFGTYALFAILTVRNFKAEKFF